ncbi:MAG: AAA family ATPase [Bacteroidales bacterium]|nr:AAA family ATPase [Bacteroidales bacterium]
MADIICRWRNGTPKTVVELVNSLPHNKMTNEAFRQFMQHSSWGNEFFHTPYQLACQLGLYCEAEDGYYYPRFDHDIIEKEAQEYLEHWMPRYYVPNPYVGRNGFNDIICPTYVLYELYMYATQHKNCTYREAYEAVFQEKPTNNNDIVKNYINNYSKVLRFEANGQLTITNTNPNTVFDFMDRNNKKEFFESFSKNDSVGRTQSLLVEQNKLTTFILSIIQYFNKKDGLNAIVPYAGSTSPIQVSKEYVFNLVGMFLESNLEEVKARNLGHTRWFEDQFTLGKRNVFLSTQWNANGDYQLTLDDFIKMIQICYGDYYVYKLGPNGEHQLWKSNLPLQQIYYGAPGSGKSNKVKKLLEKEYSVEAERDQFVFRTTFHPDSDYSTFVGCYKPRMEDDKIKYEFSPQTFTDAYVKAWQNPDKQVYLVIEEINRGNCAQIFGDLFQLLDRKRGVSEYPINADADLRQYLEKEDVLGVGHEGIANGKLKLPANLNILATMNTSDQSLFPMDSAFKRRWSWESVPIDYNNVVSREFIITIGDKQYKWTTFLESVNKRIVKATDSEDKQMGNFFINDNVKERQFIDKVMFYLWNDVCKEEFHTTNNFFRNYTDDKKTETIEFSFNALFESNSTKLLQGFMEYLEVRADGDGSKNPDTEGNTESEAE